MNRKQRRAAAKVKAWEVGDAIEVAEFSAHDNDGKSLGMGWFVVPAGMTSKQAFETQELHGPFATEPEMLESQRIELFGPQCKVEEGGMFAPGTSTPQ